MIFLSFLSFTPSDYLTITIYFIHPSGKLTITALGLLRTEFSLSRKLNAVTFILGTETPEKVLSLSQRSKQHRSMSTLAL